MLRIADRAAYFRGYCIERSAERTYKIARVVRAELTSEPATHVTADSSADPFSRSRKAWTGEPTTVRVRLDPEVAWLASEYRLLPDQRETPEPDGAVIVEAQLAGIVEALRWALAWGGTAEVLHPPELRALIAAELSQALSLYAAGGTARATEKKANPSSRAVSRRVRQRGRKVGT